MTGAPAALDGGVARRAKKQKIESESSSSYGSPIVPRPIEHNISNDDDNEELVLDEHYVTMTTNVVGVQYYQGISFMVL